MSDHSEIEYSTSEGMDYPAHDYPAHEQRFKAFVKILLIATASVATIVVLMAIFLT